MPSASKEKLSHIKYLKKRVYTLLVLSSHKLNSMGVGSLGTGVNDICGI